MLKKILNFASLFAIFPLVLAVPLAALAQDSEVPQQPPVTQEQPIFQQQPAPQMMGPDQGMMGQPPPMMGPGPQMGPEGEGMMGPDEGQGMRMGPSEEEMEKMEAQREAQEKKMRARGLAQMKKGIKQFAKGLKQVESRIAKLEKKNVPIPAELKEKISQAKAAVEAILAATDPEEVQDQMESMQEMGEMMREIMPRLEMMARLPQMIKKAGSEIKRVEKAYANMSKKAQRAKIDVSTILAKWQAVIDEIKAALAEAKAGEFGEDEDPMQIIGEGIFERLEEVWRYNQTIDMVLNIKRDLKRVATDLKRYEKRIAQLEKKGADITEARGILEELKTKYQEVSEAVKGGLEPEELEETIGDLDYYTQLQDQLEELLGLGGPILFEQQMKAPVQGGGMPQLKMPNFEKLMMGNLKEEIAQKWSVEQETLLAKYQAEKMKKLNALAVLLKAVKSKTAELTKDGVALPAELQESVANTLAAIGSLSAVAQR